MKSNFKLNRFVRFSAVIAVLMISLLFVECSNEQVTHNEEKASNSTLPKHSDRSLKAGGGTKWSDDGHTRPEFWGELDPDYIMCSEGMAQSPINLDDEYIEDGYGSEIRFEYMLSVLHVVNNGHTIKASPEIGSFIMLNGVQYDLLQFHFHAPSEHTKDNTFFPMEVHFVHSSAEGELLVLGVFFTSGNKNNKYRQIFENLPLHKGMNTQRLLQLSYENFCQKMLLPTDIRDL